MAGGTSPARCMPLRVPAITPPRRDIRLRGERLARAAQAREEGLKGWDPAKDPNVEVGALRVLRARLWLHEALHCWAQGLGSRQRPKRGGGRRVASWVLFHVLRVARGGGQGLQPVAWRGRPRVRATVRLRGRARARLCLCELQI